jgi:hypothetical protein
MGRLPKRINATFHQRTCESHEIATKNKQFSNKIPEMAHKFIPRGKRKKAKSYWNDEIEEAINERNRARKGKRMDEFIQLNKKVKKLICEAKRKSWEKFTTGISHRTEEMTI